MLIFKVLHVLSMFAAVTLTMGDSLFIANAIRRGDVRALASYQRVVGARPVIGASIFLAGIAFGLLTVATGGLDFFAGWLIAAYVLVVVLLAFQAAAPPVRKMVKLAREAVDAEEGRGSRDDVIRGMDAIRGGFPLVVGVNAVLFAAIIADMVLKPF
jgi:uncharacterized membrane protein